MTEAAQGSDQAGPSAAGGRSASFEKPTTRRRWGSPGRPRRKPEEGPKVQVGFQVTSVERDRIREAASQAGLSVSEFLRRRALGRPVVPLADAAARKALRRVGVDLNQLVRRAGSGGATEAEARAAIDDVRAALARIGRSSGESETGTSS